MSLPPAAERRSPPATFSILAARSFAACKSESSIQPGMDKIEQLIQSAHIASLNSHV